MAELFYGKIFFAGVAQGSVLGPLLFLMYINDLPGGIKSIYKMFPDDTLLFSIVNGSKQLQNTTNKDLESISTLRWLIEGLFLIAGRVGNFFKI